MITNRFNAWLLHRQLSGDSSLKLTFFTREQGLIQALYKGGRKPEKQAILQAFVPLWLTLNERRGWHYVRSVETLEPPLQLSGTALFSALYLNELLFYSLKPLDASTALYDCYQQSLELFQTKIEQRQLERQLRYFEQALLSSQGYALSFMEEAGTMTKIQAELFYHYLPEEGFYPAEKGLPGHHLLALAAGTLEEQEILKTAKYVMRKAIDHLLEGRKIKARSLFHSEKMR